MFCGSTWNKNFVYTYLKVLGVRVCFSPRSLCLLRESPSVDHLDKHQYNLAGNITSSMTVHALMNNNISEKKIFLTAWKMKKPPEGKFWKKTREKKTGPLS